MSRIRCQLAAGGIAAFSLILVLTHTAAAATIGSKAVLKNQARVILAAKGYGATQFLCFDKIVHHESSWNPRAVNASSGAYGLVQALPASKLTAAGVDWRTNPATQIRWGLSYMSSRYGSPCKAWTFWRIHHWY